MSRIRNIDLLKIVGFFLQENDEEYRLGKLFPLNVISTYEMYGWMNDNAP